MIALLIGVLLILFAVYAVLPFSWALNWWPDVVQFLKGGVPLVAVFVGLISFFVGVADIKDKIESKKEEEEEEEEAQASAAAPAKAEAPAAAKPAVKAAAPRAKTPAAGAAGAMPRKPAAPRSRTKQK